MIIRFAEEKDLPAIAAIYNQAIAVGQRTADTEPITPSNLKDWFELHDPECYPVWVAEEKDKILGYLSISPYRPGRKALRHTAEVSYYVDFSHHRRGIATQLLERAISHCPALNIKTLFAILLDSNEASIKLLEKFGFEKWGHLPRIAEFEVEEIGHFYYGLRLVK